MEEEIVKLKERVELLENVIADLSYSDRYIFQKTLQIMDGRNVLLGTSSGTKIGTAITQKLGFYNATPIVQRSGAAQNAVATTNAVVDTEGVWGYSTQAQAQAIITLENELRAWAVVQGFIKGSV